MEALCFVQALGGAQPLLVHGSSEPMMVVYKICFEFLEERGDESNFRLFMSWVQYWAAIIVFLAAAINISDLHIFFSRFVNETFGLFIAMLFFTEAILGLEHEFEYDGEEDGAGDKVDRPWRLLNGVWSTLLAVVLLVSALVLAGVRKSVLFNGTVRDIVSDYGAFVAVIIVTLLSFAIRDTPGEIPQRSQSRQVYGDDVQENWSVFHRLTESEPWLIGAAVIPGVTIAILVWMSQIVAAKLSQQEDFGVAKPRVFAWDLALEALLLVISGSFGGVPTVAALPQSPLHTKSLMNVRPRRVSLTQIGSNVRRITSQAGRVIRSAAGMRREDKDVNQRDSGSGRKEAYVSQDEDGDVQGEPMYQGEVSVTEQRGTLMGLSFFLGVSVVLEPVFTLIPRGALWGYFLFIAIESLPGNQLWHRVVLMLTDKHHRRAHHIGERTPVYVDTVPFPIIVRFTVLQVSLLFVSYAIIWAAEGALLFPVVIALTLPARHLVITRLFSKRWLRDLDKSVDVEEIIEYEEEPSEKRGGIHEYFTGETFGGHGPFGQVRLVCLRCVPRQVSTHRTRWRRLFGRFLCRRCKPRRARIWIGNVAVQAGMGMKPGNAMGMTMRRIWTLGMVSGGNNDVNIQMPLRF